MKYSVKQYAQSLYEALADTAPKDHEKVIDNLLKVMERNQDTALFPKVIQEFENVSAKAQGEVEVNATFARNDVDNKDVLEALNKMGYKKVKLNTSVDESLVGGVVIRMEDTLVDASIKTTLEDMRKSMVN